MGELFEGRGGLAGHVFFDESKSKGYFLVASVVVSGDLAAARSTVRGLLAPGQKRLHMKSEGDRRRRQILSAFTAIEVQAGVLVADPGHGTDLRRRQACLAGLVAMIAREGHSHLSLESDESQDARDRQTLAHLVRGSTCAPDFRYQHRRAVEEPLLALPDAIAWAYARGGDWKRRAQPLIRQVIDV